MAGDEALRCVAKIFSQGPRPAEAARCETSFWGHSQSGVSGTCGQDHRNGGPGSLGQRPLV